MEPLELQTDLQECQGREQTAHHLLGGGETKEVISCRLENFERNNSAFFLSNKVQKKR